MNNFDIIKHLKNESNCIRQKSDRNSIINKAALHPPDRTGMNTAERGS
jgi:hypothetical protein